ncbi:hypothetical protein [Acetivibrio cellulolyticus]
MKKYIRYKNFKQNKGKTTFKIEMLNFDLPGAIPVDFKNSIWGVQATNKWH